ncbi:MAG TPA: electron transfer flavoprotein subunit alpha/FixB family protein [Chloroflexota bacterium]|nr:electron transfer flavoprotein subunit alpha/FixB family protein [Chloroflexota bacterium]
MAGDILVYVEHDGPQPRHLALETVSKAAEVTEAHGGQVIAAVLGGGADGTIERLGRFGADTVYQDAGPVFDDYLTEPAVEYVAALIAETNPTAILLPYTQDGKDIGSRLSARLSAGAVANVVNVLENNGRLDAIETVFGGNYSDTVEVERSPLAILLVRANAFTAEEHPRQPAVKQMAFEPSEAAKRAQVGRRVQEEGTPTPIEEAQIIVSGGRGLGGPEPFGLLEELAGELGGVVGASRAAVDAGWISYPHQVGQTGRTVKPQLYMAIGISGAVQHRVGMQTADTIIAVNRDKDAPIFQLADLAVVGDLFQIVPALTEEIKRRKGGAT